MPDTEAEPRSVKVWDLPVRLFHWALVAVVTVAGITESGPPSWLGIHVWAGYALAGLLVLRVVWGFLGSEHSRFAGFRVSPAATLGHLKDLMAGRPTRHLGHNPAGTAMIVALLLLLAAMAATGFMALGGQFKQGPLAPFLPFGLGQLARNVHSLLFNLLLGLVALHVAGVVAEMVLTRDNLVRAMIDGRKAAQPGHPATGWRHSRPLAAAVLGALLLLALGGGVMAVAALPPRGVHPLSPPASFAQECGACHFAFPPSLLPAASWDDLMAHLDHHFGETASLDAATAAEIRGYLTRNAAETWDTLPAHMFRRVDPAQPESITATPYWQRRHRDVDPALFKTAKVGGKAMCNACHTDAASGLFSPQGIDPPEQ